MLIYVDNVLNLEHDPKEYMDDFNHTYILEEESVGPSKRYHGANVEKFHMENGN